jgi:hypothetical protein
LETCDTAGLEACDTKEKTPPDFPAGFAKVADD